MRITLLEATGRLGGKVLTSRFDSVEARYEAGAAEFYDYSAVDEDPLRSLVAELGLSPVPLAGSAVMLDGAVLGGVEDWQTHLGAEATRSLLDFDRRAKGAESPGEFYESGTLCVATADGGGPAGGAGERFDAEMARVRHPAARRYLETLLKSDLATEPAVTSVAYGRQNYLMNDPAYMGLYAIAGGNEQLVTRLADSLDAEVRLGTRAVAVGRHGDGRIEIRLVGPRGTEETIAFDAVVLALPMNHLDTLAWNSPRLSEAMRLHHRRHAHPGHYLRITLAFDRAFWRKAVPDSFFMLDRFGGCCLYDESAREPGQSAGVLGCLLGGVEAERLAVLDDDSIVSQVLESLPASLGSGRLLEARVHRWTGAVSGLPGGPIPLDVDRRHRPEPVEHGRLFLVGDYLFDSTLNGVLDSAAHVAGWITSLAES
jgi:monoamine oxidase